jgi:anti-sigma B factor antagonist
MAGKKDQSGGVIKDISRQGDVVILRLLGDIDMRHATELRSELLQINREAPATTIINMEEVDFMDSSGIAVLVESLQLHRRGRRQLKLAGLHPRVRSVFEIARLDTIFQIYDNETEALAS